MASAGDSAGTCAGSDVAFSGGAEGCSAPMPCSDEIDSAAASGQLFLFLTKQPLHRGILAVPVKRISAKQ